MFDWFKRKPKKYLIDPNGQHQIQSSRHLTGLASDGAPNCDRCKNGDLLSCMDPCQCGRMG